MYLVITLSHKAKIGISHKVEQKHALFVKVMSLREHHSMEGFLSVYHFITVIPHKACISYITVVEIGVAICSGFPFQKMF